MSTGISEQQLREEIIKSILAYGVINESFNTYGDIARDLSEVVLGNSTKTAIAITSENLSELCNKSLIRREAHIKVNTLITLYTTHFSGEKLIENEEISSIFLEMVSKYSWDTELHYLAYDSLANDILSVKKQ